MIFVGEVFVSFTVLEYHTLHVWMVIVALLCFVLFWGYYITVDYTGSVGCSLLI